MLINPIEISRYILLIIRVILEVKTALLNAIQYVYI